jgi:hypothetical protein
MYLVDFLQEKLLQKKEAVNLLRQPRLKSISFDKVFYFKSLIKAYILCIFEVCL